MIRLMNLGPRICGPWLLEIFPCGLLLSEFSGCFCSGLIIMMNNMNLMPTITFLSIFMTFKLSPNKI